MSRLAVEVVYEALGRTVARTDERYDLARSIVAALADEGELRNYDAELHLYQANIHARALGQTIAELQESIALAQKLQAGSGSS